VPDLELWHDFAGSIKPLGRRQRNDKRVPFPKKKLAMPTASPGMSRPPRRERTEPPPLAAFDRRTAQRLLRGQVEIDSRIDLHGMGIEQAKDAVFRYLSAAQANGLRTVVVVTGKGDSPFARHTLHGAAFHQTPERRGKLRALLPEWLAEPHFRLLVSGYQPAHPRHGGGGAFYVKIRRLRG
jgi:DNA-nicking Smr family endonuclease